MAHDPSSMLGRSEFVELALSSLVQIHDLVDRQMPTDAPGAGFQDRHASGSRSAAMGSLHVVEASSSASSIASTAAPSSLSRSARAWLCASAKANSSNRFSARSRDALDVWSINISVPRATGYVPFTFVGFPRGAAGKGSFLSISSERNNQHGIRCKSCADTGKTYGNSCLGNRDTPVDLIQINVRAELHAQGYKTDPDHVSAECAGVRDKDMRSDDNAPPR
jgi:hypothetical protein